MPWKFRLGFTFFLVKLQIRRSQNLSVVKIQDGEDTEKRWSFLGVPAAIYTPGYTW